MVAHEVAALVTEHGCELGLVAQTQERAVVYVDIPGRDRKGVELGVAKRAYAVLAMLFRIETVHHGLEVCIKRRIAKQQTQLLQVRFLFARLE